MDALRCYVHAKMWRTERWKEVSLEMAAFERERKMPYVTSIERIAREEGKNEGMAAAKVDALLRFLTKRFHGTLPSGLEANIRATDDLEKLDSWIDASGDAGDLEEFRRTCGI
jgi:hypothetical protein